MKQLTVIIPSNEPLKVVQEFLPNITEASSGTIQVSIILVDSRFQAGVQSFCETLSVQYLFANEACRAAQLNQGAAQSNGDYLFFLHLDSVLPRHYDLLIKDAFEKAGDSGCFRMRFSPTTRFLNFWAYFTRFHWRVARGGDQGLFVKRKVFEQVGGYRNWPVMEDVQICHALEKKSVFRIIKTPIITSSRKYQAHGQVYLQTVFTLLMLLFWVGVKPQRLSKMYNWFLKKD